MLNQTTDWSNPIVCLSFFRYLDILIILAFQIRGIDVESSRNCTPSIHGRRNRISTGSISIQESALFEENAKFSNKFHANYKRWQIARWCIKWCFIYQNIFANWYFPVFKDLHENSSVIDVSIDLFCKVKRLPKIS